MRGDIITEINGTEIDINNYSDLFYSEELTLGFAEFRDGFIYPSDRIVVISAVVLEENPVLEEGKKEEEPEEIDIKTENDSPEDDGDILAFWFCSSRPVVERHLSR